MPRSPHPWLTQVPDAPHGGAAADNTLLDLSASIAPLGPSPAAIDAARTAPIHIYPSRRASALARAVAAELAVDESRILPGPGAADLLLRAALAHLRPGDTAVLVAPCFGEYARAALACGAHLATWTATPPTFALDVDAIATLCTETDAALAFLARPANPTGVPIPLEQVQQLIQATPSTTWVLDEAFLDFCDDRRSAAGGEAIVLRSLTKDLALPGLRVAALDAPPHVTDALRALTPPWCVSTAAIAAAVAGLADTAHREATRTASTHGRHRLHAALDAAGTEHTDAAANYVCARVGDEERACQALAANGIRVRPCADLGLPGWIRIAVPHPDDLDRTCAAVAASLTHAAT